MESADDLNWDVVVEGPRTVPTGEVRRVRQFAPDLSRVDLVGGDGAPAGVVDGVALQ